MHFTFCLLSPLIHKKTLQTSSNAVINPSKTNDQTRILELILYVLEAGIKVVLSFYVVVINSDEKEAIKLEVQSYILFPSSPTARQPYKHYMSTSK